MAPTPMQVAELSKIRFRETPEYLGCDGPLLIHRDGTSECRGSCHGEPRHDRYHGRISDRACCCASRAAPASAAAERAERSQFAGLGRRCERTAIGPLGHDPVPFASSCARTVSITKPAWR